MDAKSNGALLGGVEGGGMSRAAKKRAKKKNKDHQQQPSSSHFVKEATAASTSSSSSFKRSKPDDNDLDDKDHEGNSLGAETKRFKGCLKQSSYQTTANNDGNGDGDEEDGARNDCTISLLDDGSDIPSVPSNIPIVDFLLLHDNTEVDPSDIETHKILQGMTAKQRAASLLQAILDPISLKEFYKVYWEKKPLLVRATSKNKHRYAGLLSLKGIKVMTKEHPLYYGRDLNVTKYKKGKDGMKRRVTLDHVDEGGEGAGDEDRNPVQVDTPELWSNYDNGCTIRLLCPHKHSDPVQSLLSTLEMEFQCMVGANAYLTPPKFSQGFAPHYDDIEAFCLQLEGSKRWKVYEPTLKLPRASSEDFTTDELEGLKTVLDVTLEEGDLLYMPRGWIHQACTLKDDTQHSLHLTVSAMQQWAWVDLLEMVMPEALEAAAMREKSSSLRQGLPKGFVDYMGVMYEDTKDDKLPDSLKKLTEQENKEDSTKKRRFMLQEQFRAEAKKRIMRIANTACEMIDATCDQMAKRFVAERQPPALTADEKALTCQGDESADEKPILPNTLCRLVRPGIGRLVVEDDKAVVYHCADNSRIFQEHPISPLEFEMDDGPSLEQLLTTVEPAWIVVNDLYHDSIEDKIAIAQALYDEGILAIRQTDEESEA